MLTKIYFNLKIPQIKFFLNNFRQNLHNPPTNIPDTSEENRAVQFIHKLIRKMYIIKLQSWGITSASRIQFIYTLCNDFKNSLQNLIKKQN